MALKHRAGGSHAPAYTIIEYDPQKNQSNIAKHGISFITASKAFDDPNALVNYDDYHSDYYEDRYNLIASVNDHILFIVYTMRDEAVRIISARPATKREIERYYGR